MDNFWIGMSALDILNAALLLPPSDEKVEEETEVDLTTDEVLPPYIELDNDQSYVSADDTRAATLDELRAMLVADEIIRLARQQCIRPTRGAAERIAARYMERFPKCSKEHERDRARSFIALRAKMPRCRDRCIEPPSLETLVEWGVTIEAFRQSLENQREFEMKNRY